MLSIMKNIELIFNFKKVEENRSQELKLDANEVVEGFLYRKIGYDEI